jgi:CHAT domain-containing protein
LAVIQSSTKGQRALPSTKVELRKIEDHVPSKSLVRLGVSGAPALIEQVLKELAVTSIVHFACHGEQHPENPLDSAFLLEDGPLKVSRIMEQSTVNASFAFLSACQTAMGDENLPDEAMHLAATLLFAGFRGVVATMW